LEAPVNSIRTDYLYYPTLRQLFCPLQQPLASLNASSVQQKPEGCDDLDISIAIIALDCRRSATIVRKSRMKSESATQKFNDPEGANDTNKKEMVTMIFVADYAE